MSLVATEELHPDSALLSQGAIPLSLLETLIADWIESERERLAEET